LASQRIEKCSTSPELAEQSLMEIQQYVASAEEFKLSSPKEFRSLFQDSITPETKALVTQVSEAICIPLLHISLVKSDDGSTESLQNITLALNCHSLSFYEEWMNLFFFFLSSFLVVLTYTYCI
jgi:hypothetical protein